MIRVLFAGDFAPIGNTEPLFEGENASSLLEEVFPLASGADYSIVNLEAPVGVRTNKIKKHGPVLKSSESALKALAQSGFKCVALANNHIMDLGGDSILRTIETCTTVGLDTVGAGNDSFSAAKVLYKSIGDENLAVINCCEKEFSIAGEKTPGANALDAVAIHYAIKEASSKADYVVVYVHGGIEHYKLPTPAMKTLYRFFIDSGADCVVNSHQHCFSGYEIFKGKPIIYGLGNFCFDMKSRYGDEGYLAMVSLSREKTDLELFPYLQNNGKAGVGLLEDRHSFDEEIALLNQTIESDEELTRSYEKFIDSNDIPYIYCITPYRSRVTTTMFFHGLLPRNLGKSKLRMIYDYINCVSHRDRFLKALEKRMK